MAIATLGPPIGGGSPSLPVGAWLRGCSAGQTKRNAAMTATATTAAISHGATPGRARVAGAALRLAFCRAVIG